VLYNLTPEGRCGEGYRLYTCAEKWRDASLPQNIFTTLTLVKNLVVVKYQPGNFIHILK